MTRKTKRLFTMCTLAALGACSFTTTAEMTIRNELPESLPRVVIRVADESVTWTNASAGGEFKHTFTIGRDSHYEVEILHLDGSVTTTTGGYMSSGFNTKDTIHVREPRLRFESKTVQ